MKISNFFNNKDITTILYNKYQPVLSDTTVRLFGSDLSIEEYNCIWDNIEKKLMKLSMAEDLFAVVFYCYRTYIFAGINSKQLIISNDRTILKNCTDYPNTKNLNNILSLFSRKQFDYFIDRYFYLKNNVNVNTKYEKQIANIMKLKGNLSILKVNGISPLRAEPKYYPYYLLSISDSILSQIGGKESIIPEDDIMKLSFLLQRFTILRVSFMICLIIALITLLIILVQIH